MEKLTERRSAKIYQFPISERIAANARTATSPPAEVRPPRATGGAWYHDAAIQESSPGADI
ncbi:MAG TPA: DUF2735 domain-containing protein [Rhodopseudomonas sp.]|uniref:DUF2735 domain-containing protein n=1 Tax=Rhodopseudomonas sp. TaxID=1078 RepID=UPI002EDAA983